MIVSLFTKRIDEMTCLYAKISGTEIVLLILIYLRVATSLASSMRFVSSDLISSSFRENRSIHFISSMNEIRIVQLKLSLAEI